MMSVVVDSSEIRCPMSGFGMKVKAPFLLLSFSQACQSQSHLKCEVNISFGQFLITNVTAGQQIESPNLSINRFAGLVLSVFLIWIGARRKRLIFKFLFV